MTSIQGVGPRDSSSSSASSQGLGHSDAAEEQTQVSLGDLFAAKAPAAEASLVYPRTYDTKYSRKAADRLLVAARILGASALVEGAALCDYESRRAKFLRDAGGIGLVASVAALWAARHLAAQNLAQANKALVLAMRAGCGVKYEGWTSGAPDHQGVWANQQGSVPVVVATNETGLVGPTRVVVEQCPESAITVVALAHSRDTAAAGSVAQSVAQGTQRAIAALSRPDDPCQVRAALKHAIQMPRNTSAPGLVDIVDLIADDAVVETTTIALHKDGPAVIGHLGRARAILCENGRARALTVRHTMDVASEAARAKREAARAKKDADPSIRDAANLSRGLVKKSKEYHATRAQVTFVPSAKHADAAIVLLSPELAAKLNDAEVAERLKGVAFDSPEACGFTADLVGLGRQRGGGQGLAAAVVPYGPKLKIDYSHVVPRSINAGRSQSRTQTRRRPPPMLKRKGRNGVNKPLIS